MSNSLASTPEYTITPVKECPATYPILNSHNTPKLFIVSGPDSHLVALAYLFPGDQTIVTLPSQVEYQVSTIDLLLGSVSYFPDASAVNNVLHTAKIYKLDIRHISNINKTILASAVKAVEDSSGTVNIYGVKKDKNAVKSISSETLIRNLQATDTLKVAMDDISQYAEVYITIVGDVDTAFNYK